MTENSMSRQRLNAEVEDTSSPHALKVCLEYLYQEAVRAGYGLPAHFIAVAARAMDDHLPRRETPAEDDGTEGREPPLPGNAVSIAHRNTRSGR